MHVETWKLVFIYWFGGGMLVFFAWASVLGEAVIGSRHRPVRAAVSALSVLGIIHPIAAFASVDLARLCSSLEGAAGWTSRHGPPGPPSPRPRSASRWPR